MIQKIDMKMFPILSNNHMMTLSQISYGVFKTDLYYTTLEEAPPRLYHKSSSLSRRLLQTISKWFEPRMWHFLYTTHWHGFICPKPIAQYSLLFPHAIAISNEAYLIMILLTQSKLNGHTTPNINCIEARNKTHIPLKL